MSVLTTPMAVAYINRAKGEGQRYALGEATLIKLADEGKVKALKLGRGYLFAEEALDRWLANGMQP